MLHFGRKNSRNKDQRLPKEFIKALEVASRDVYHEQWLKKEKQDRNIVLNSCESPQELFLYVDTLSEWQVSLELAKFGFTSEELGSITDVVQRLILFDMLSKSRRQQDLV